MCIRDRPLIAIDPHPQNPPPVSLEGQIVAHCQAWSPYRANQQPGAQILFRLEEPLHIQPPQFIFGAIPEVVWLTRPREWMEELRQAIQDLAVNERVIVYRLWIEPVEHDGKRYYQIAFLYDI